MIEPYPACGVLRSVVRALQEAGAGVREGRRGVGERQPEDRQGSERFLSLALL